MHVLTRRRVTGSIPLAACALFLWADAPRAAEPTPVQSISFELDVQPVLTAAGCNSGACHGKQRGQNGFQLSLFGFDSDFDFAAIAEHARGRRVFPAVPAESLLLRKATADIPHGGGERFDQESDAYRTLAAWIEQGAPRALADEPELLQVELAETSFRLQAGAAQRLRVVARYSDQTERDVTGLATYVSNEAAVVAVSADGVLTAGQLPGETAVMARYMNHIQVAEVVIPFSGSRQPAEYTALPRANFIDDLIFKKLAVAATLPSEPVDDATFLRRATTDLIGRFPTVEEAREFLETESENKREYLIDALLDKPEYADHWANQWADLLRPNPYRVGIKAVLNYDQWIREQFRGNAPYDEFARRLITAQGSTWRNGSVTLYRDRRTPDEMATLVSQLFLGVRLECAKCHHHPFENWSQDDFYQFAAFFANVSFKGTGISPPISGGEETVFTSAKGEVRHPLTGQVMPAEPLFGELPPVPAAADDRNPADAPVDLRAQLAEWMTSRDNPYFAQVQVNRVWVALMGRGLVEPVDDLRSTNPASNPQLLNALAEYFQQNDYDLKALIKVIALSNAYAFSSLPNETNLADRLNYSRHYRHRFRAEVLADAIADITETEHTMGGMPAGSRANQVWTHRVSSLFLDTFGRPDENQDPPCERTSDSTVTQALHLMNSRELDSRVRSDSGRAARLASSQATATEIAEELYLAIFSRYPTPAELEYASGLVSGSPQALSEPASGEQSAEARRRAIEDLMWAMLNAPECTIQN